MRLKVIWQRLRGLQNNDKSDALATTNTVMQSSQSRALEWLGKDLLQRQYFYEYWAARENWLVHDEGLCLLMGRDPDDPDLKQDQEFLQQRQTFWEHLQHCVAQRIPPRILNPEVDTQAWRVAPVELYRWAVTARVPIPPELDNLLAFISSNIGHIEEPRVADAANTESDIDSQLMDRERVLSIMLSLSLRAQYEATHQSADILRDRILEALYEKSESYFNSAEPPLGRPALHDLIDRSLETAGLIHVPG